MSVNPLFLLEFLLFDGGALAWAAWEYWQIRPSRGRRDEAQKDAGASPKDTRHPEG